VFICDVEYKLFLLFSLNVFPKKLPCCLLLLLEYLSSSTKLVVFHQVVFMDPHSRSLEEYSYWDSFAVEAWYPLVEEHTFKTVFVNVSEQEARALLAEQILLAERRQETVEELSDDLKSLEVRLRGAFHAVGGSAFVKLNDRSPKDGAFAGKRIVSCLHAAIARGEERNLVTVYRAMMRSLKCESAREAIILLLESFRILQDVALRLKMLDEKSFPFHLSVAVREFCDSVDAVVEYRCFTNGSELTCVSQYIYDCFVPEIFENKEEHAQLIETTWRCVANRVAKVYKHAVIDFGIVNGKAVVIEMNPFDESTDSGLFPWLTNRSLLTDGKGENATFPEISKFVMRIVERELTWPKAQQRWWKKLLEES
jgi:hypothetical protein